MNYAKTAATSLKLLTKFGQNVTRRTFTAGSYDPATGAVSNATADTTRKGVLLDFGSAQTNERGTLIQSGDKRLLMDAQGAALMTDHYIIGAIEYTVVSIGEISPAGTVTLYDLHIRT